MAMTREPLLTPNDTTGEALRLRADLTNDEVETAVICDTVDALQANAIAARLPPTKEQCKGLDFPTMKGVGLGAYERMAMAGRRSELCDGALVVLASELVGGGRPT